MSMDREKVEFIESYIKTSLGDYKWNGNNGELIRCKDCKHMNSPKGCVMFCEHIHTFVNEDWFCADGKRKAELPKPPTNKVEEEKMSDTEKMLEKACKILNDIDSDFFCEELNNGDGWCEEHCVQNGYVSCIECVKRWLKKQIKEDQGSR